MRYVSTRGGESRSFLDVLLEGLAKNGGLYVPEEYPALGSNALLQMRAWSYQEIAVCIIKLFVGKDISDIDIRKIVWASYNPHLFGGNVAPIESLGRRLGLMKLYTGPTWAFKDYALQLVANLMDHALKLRDERLNLLGATSGDTGSAAEEAVRGRERLRIFMLSPFGRMSAIQRKQMYCIHDPRVFNLVPDAPFDDCQRAVKLVNEDIDFKDQYSIGAVNSINWARIMAQVVYYVYAYVRMTGTLGERLTVSVPSGNFGNVFAAYVAARMGCNLRIIVATNENDVLHEYYQTGVYRVRSKDNVLETFSPSMDICEASNFERLAFDLGARSQDTLAFMWGLLKKEGKIQLPYQTEFVGGVEFLSGTATDDEVLKTMKSVFERTGVIIDPHTAVAAKVFYDLEPQLGDGPSLIVGTAAPQKFQDAVKQATGLQLAIPESARELFANEERFVHITESDPDAIAEEVKLFMMANAA